MARFVDAIGERRCEFDITMSDGSGAQCGRSKSATSHQYCWQHERKPKCRSLSPLGGGFRCELREGHWSDHTAKNGAVSWNFEATTDPRPAHPQRMTR